MVNFSNVVVRLAWAFCGREDETHKGNLKHTGFSAVLVAAVIAMSNPAFADDSDLRMHAHNTPFVSGVAPAGSSSVPRTVTSGPRHPHGENVANVIDQIKNNVQKAVVVFLPPDFESPILPTEWQFKNMGCATRDPSRIASLIDLLQRSNLRVARSPIPSSNDGWEQIYLTLADGAEIKVGFDLTAPPANEVLGTFQGPLGQVQYLVASPLLPKELYLWAERTGQTGSGSPQCRQWDKKKIEELFKNAELK